MKLVDANVFVYAIGREHPYREACRALLRAVAENAVQATVDVEVLQELLHHYHALGMTARGIAAVRQTLAAFPNALSVTLPIVRRSVDILEAHPRLQSRDAIHAAVVLENHLEGIISADRGFDTIEGVRRFDPKEFA